MRISKISRLFGFGSFLVVVAVVSFVVAKPFAVTDWLKLRGYKPPAIIVQLADQTTMTEKSRHLFYINHPGLEDKATFRANCDKFGEKTIVVGCYQGGQRGIHVLEVSDERLRGIEQVTAAHEMLHAAYERLGDEEKSRVDTLLQDYADNQLADDRIRKTLKGYEQTEPGQQLNEMHAIFGTEIIDLPAPLELYYSQYFSNRKLVANFAGQYQAAFTSRQAAIDDYDEQLKLLSIRVKSNTSLLAEQQTQIETIGQQLETYRNSGDINSYNDGVGPYNAKIDAFNQLISETGRMIDQYNLLVVTRNELAAQATELQQAIDSSSLPRSK